MNLTIGKHYFVLQRRRVDSFAHKQFTTPELEQWESLIAMGQLVEQRGGEIKLKLTGNDFERDGEEYVFSTGNLLCAPGGDTRTLEDHGKPTTPLGRWIADGAHNP